ncbi:MAG: glycosyltransferase family 2 protein [Nanoarchaeota archaeon]|nr:glycosyltransferase family 2 protein [Nanoarchaeota archaeon]MBU1005142.1 glycosyltransferase family 2 protein [Nanoarchaeota archaeon]MBU1946009.1 glycosyltransferase family 2 protein [Nanoarchaeota archaeon]
MKNKIFAIIPARNEDKNIGRVISEAKKYVDNIVVVDDGSSDNTRYKAKKQGAVVLSHIINLGKGAALKTGCDYALKQGAEKIVVLDADTQHEPSKIPDFLKELDYVDVVLGYRQLSKTMPPLLKIGNLAINKITRLLYRMNLHDTQCGYRAFTQYAYKKIRWNSSNYSMESEMIANIGKARLKYKEIPIKTIYADRYKGTTIIDGIKIVFNLFWWRLSK